MSQDINKISMTTKQRQKSDARKRFLLIAIPFVLINSIIAFLVTSTPKLKLEIENHNNFMEVSVHIKKNRFYPIKSFELALDTTPLTYTSKTSGLTTTYSTVINHNGTISLLAKGYNGMSQTEYEHVGSIDDAPPLIFGEVRDDGLIFINFEDTQSGINFAAMYGLDEDGNIIKPLKIDESNLNATFPYEGDSLDIHVLDNVGNESVASFNKMENNSTW